MRFAPRTVVAWVFAVVSSSAAAHDGGVMAAIEGAVILSMVPGGVLGWFTGRRAWPLVFSVPGALALFAASIILIEVSSVWMHASSYEHYTEDMVFLGSAAIFPFVLCYGATYALAVWKRKAAKATAR